MRYTGPKEKLSRKVGENLALKAERSLSTKSAFLRKPYRPGMHGKKMRRALSEYGSQLLAKQKVKFTYGIAERQFKNYYKKARSLKGVAGDLLLSLLEKRLDNVVFRAGFTPSRPVARQLVNHGHFTVNDKRANIPSHEVRVGDIIAIKSQSKNKKIFAELALKLKKHLIPLWLDVDKKNFTIKIKAEPSSENLPKNFNTSAVIEFYSR